MNEIIDSIVKSGKSDSTVWNLSAQLENAVSLKEIILTALRIGLLFAIIIVEVTLHNSAQPIEKNLICPECGKPLQSKGFISRLIISIISLIQWRRRGWRCPCGCAIGLITPFDRAIA